MRRPGPTFGTEFALRNIPSWLRRALNLTDTAVPRRMATEFKDDREQPVVNFAFDPFQRGFAIAEQWVASSVQGLSMSSATLNGIAIADTRIPGDSSGGFYLGNHSESGFGLLLWIAAWRETAAAAVANIEVSFWLKAQAAVSTAPGGARSVPIAQASLAPNVTGTRPAASMMNVGNGKPIFMPAGMVLWVQAPGLTVAGEGSIAVEAIGFKVPAGFYPQG